MLNKKLLGILIFSVFFMFGHLVSAEETHVITTIVVEVKGKTSPDRIKAFLKLKEGEEFSTFQNLSEYIKSKEQELINYRVFSDTSSSIHNLATQNGISEWEVRFKVTDAFTFAPIPYPKYNSNTGFRIGMKNFYDNAFGTMSDIFLGFGLDIGPYKTPGDEQWKIGNWNVDLRWNRIRLGPLQFFAGYNQSYEIKTLDTGNEADDFHYSFYRSEIAFGSSIPLWHTGISYGFSLAFNMRYEYKNYMESMNYLEEPFDFTWTHSLSLGKVNWHQNFRHGQSIGVGHSISTVLDPASNKYFITNSLSVTGSIYRPFAQRFNYYGLAALFFRFNSIDSGIGSNLRGVADDGMAGNYGGILSNSLAFQFWRLKNFWDAQVHVFIDVAYASMYGDKLNMAEDFRYSAGLDFVLFLDKIPNLTLRGMIGADLSRYEWSDWSKYEVTISSSLQY